MNHSMFMRCAMQSLQHEQGTCGKLYTRIVREQEKEGVAVKLSPEKVVY